MQFVRPFMNHRVHFSRLIQQQFVTRYFVVEKEFSSHITLTLSKRILLRFFTVGYAPPTDNNMQHDILIALWEFLLCLNWLWLHRAVASHLCNFDLKLHFWFLHLRFFSSSPLWCALNCCESIFQLAVQRATKTNSSRSYSQLNSSTIHVDNIFSANVFFLHFLASTKKIVNFFSHKS